MEMKEFLEESMVQFDGYMSTVVPESIIDRGEAVHAVVEPSNRVMDSIVEDSVDETDSSVEKYGEETKSTVDPPEEAAVGQTYPIVSDFGDDTEATGEPIVSCRRLKVRLPKAPLKVMHPFDLNEQSEEEKMMAAKCTGERDFDLNKLPIAGMFRLRDPTWEPEFILMLRILLPEYY